MIGPIPASQITDSVERNPTLIRTRERMKPREIQKLPLRECSTMPTDSSVFPADFCYDFSDFPLDPEFFSPHMTNPNIHVLYSTFPNQTEAETVAGLLLEQNLIACANIFGQVRSLYRWEGQLHNDPEVILIAKTSADKLESAIEMLTRLHSFDCPCVTSWAIEAGNPAYLKWVAGEVN